MSPLLTMGLGFTFPDTSIPQVLLSGTGGFGHEEGVLNGWVVSSRGTQSCSTSYMLPTSRLGQRMGFWAAGGFRSIPGTTWEMTRWERDPSIHSSWGDQDAGTQIQCPPSLMLSLCRPDKFP